MVLTLCILVGYAAAGFVQLPFLNLAVMGELLASANAAAYERTSIVALGIIPWLSVCILLETIATLIAPLRRWRVFGGGHVDPFHPIVVGLTVLVAGLQAYGIAVGLQAAGLVQADVAAVGTAAMMASLIGGTVLMIVGASLIERYGIGFGFWMMIAVSFLSVFIGAFSTVSQMVVRGVISDVKLLTEILVVAAAVLATVWLTRLISKTDNQKEKPDFGVVIWPTLVALQLAGMVVSGLLVLFPSLEFSTAQSGIRIISVLLAVVSVVLLVLFITASLRRAGLQGAIIAANVVIISLFLTPYIFELTGARSNLVWMLLSPLGQFAATIALLTIFAARLYRWWSSSPSTTRSRN